MQQSGMIEINGAQLYYEMRGEGRPLALIHAGIADCRMWDDQVDAFARHYTVIRYDHAGYGRSQAPSNPAARHEDLYGLLRALGVEQAYALGISMGGTYAIECALAHPQAISALVLVGSWLSGFNSKPSDEEIAIWRQFEAALNAGDIAHANELEVDLKLVGIHRTPDMVAPRVRERLRELHLTHFARRHEEDQTQWVHLEPPANGRLGEIHVPTLVLVGELDVPTVHLLGDTFAAEIPGAHKALMRNTAHVPNMEWPDEFNRITLDFLQSLGA